MKARLQRFYSFYNPSCVSTVDAILANYSGREEELMRVLTTKYGPEPPLGDESTSGTTNRVLFQSGPGKSMAPAPSENRFDVVHVAGVGPSSISSQRASRSPSAGEVNHSPHYTAPVTIRRNIQTVQQEIHASYASDTGKGGAVSRTNSGFSAQHAPTMSGPSSSRMRLEALMAEMGSGPQAQTKSSVQPSARRTLEDLAMSSPQPNSTVTLHANRSDRLPRPVPQGAMSALQSATPSITNKAYAKAKGKLLAFYSIHNVAMIPFVEDVLTSAGVVGHGDTSDSSIEEATEALLAELVKTVHGKASAALPTTSTAGAQQASRSASKKASPLLRSPSAPKDNVHTIAPRSLSPPTRSTALRSLSNLSTSNAGAIKDHGAAAQPAVDGPLSHYLHKKAATEMADLQAKVQQRDSIIVQLSSELEKKVDELERLQLKGSASMPREEELEKVMHLLSDAEQHHKKEQGKMERWLKVANDKNSQLQEELAEAHEKLFGTAFVDKKLHERELVRLQCEVDRIQSMASVAEHHLRMAKMKCGYLQEEASLKDERMEVMVGERQALEQQVKALLTEVSSLRLQLGSYGNTDESRAQFNALVQEIQQRFEAHYEHRLSLAEAETQEYYLYAKKQISNRDDMIAKMTDHIEQEARQVATAASSRLVETFPDSERRLAEEVARLQTVLATQRGEHSSALGEAVSGRQEAEEELRIIRARRAGEVLANSTSPARQILEESSEARAQQKVSLMPAHSGNNSNHGSNSSSTHVYHVPGQAAPPTHAARTLSGGAWGHMIAGPDTATYDKLKRFQVLRSASQDEEEYDASRPPSMPTSTPPPAPLSAGPTRNSTSPQPSDPSYQPSAVKAVGGYASNGHLRKMTGLINHGR